MMSIHTCYLALLLTLLYCVLRRRPGEDEFDLVKSINSIAIRQYLLEFPVPGLSHDEFLQLPLRLRCALDVSSESFHLCFLIQWIDSN